MSRNDQHDHWAIAAVVSEHFLNALALTAVDTGVEVEEFRQSFAVPMMGTVDLAVSMTITEVHFAMHKADRGRLRATVSTAGRVRMLGDVETELPGPVRVRGEVLVSPRVRLTKSGEFRAVLDLARSTLVATHFDGVEGVESDAEALAQMGEMLFSAVGGELFGGLARHMGQVGLDLGAHDGRVLLEAGCRPGPATIRIEDGRMLVGLRAEEGLAGRADPGAPEGVSLGVGVAAGALSTLVTRALADRTGVPVPVEFEITAHERRVGTIVRNPRLIDSFLVPDLRPEWRTTLRPRLVDDHVEIGLRTSWLHLPMAPEPVNALSRWLGGAASRLPLEVRFPARGELPVRPDSDQRLSVAVSRLDVGEDGVHLVVDAHL